MKIGWWWCWLWLLPAAGQAATFVVAAGVEQYDDTSISPLTYAVADAKAVASAFRASGVAAEQVVVLTSDQVSPARKPTRGRLIRALEEVRRAATADDKLIFFFAGHGVEQDGEQFLLCQDTSQQLLADTALPMSLVARALQGLQAAEVLFLIDACRNDPQQGARGDEPRELSETFARGLRPKLDEARQPAKPALLATLLACDIGQRAWEDPDAGHGVFTTYLLRGLAGAGASAAGKPVMLSGLAGYVTRQLQLWSGRTNKQQTPRLINPGGGDMVLLTPPPEPIVSVAFQNETLADAVDVIAEQYGAQVVLGKGVDPEARVTGRLDSQPLAATLRVLLLAHDLAVRRDGNVYIIEPRFEAQPLAEVQLLLGDLADDYPGPLLVASADGSTPYATIQSAVDAAPKGAIVAVAPGTYDEMVTIDRNIALVGVGGWEQTVIRNSSAATVWITESAGQAALVSLTLLGLLTPGTAIDTVFCDGGGTIVGCDLRAEGETSYNDDGTALIAHSLRVTPAAGRAPNGLRVVDSRLSGLGAVVAAPTRFEACDIANCGLHGIVAEPGAQLEIVDSLVRDTVGHGLLMRGGEAHVERSAMTYCGGSGLAVEDGQAVVLGSQLTRAGGHGLQVDARGVATLSDCEITENDHCGSQVSAGGGLTAAGCDLRRNGRGAMLHVPQARIALSGNRFDAGDPGLALDPSGIVPDPVAGENERLLFNGRDLAGWQAVDDNGRPVRNAFHVERGVLVADGPNFTNLVTEERFAEFFVSLDFRLYPGANNGLLFFVGRPPRSKRLEVQINDVRVDHPTMQLGAIHRVLRPDPAPQIEPGNWTNLTLLVRRGRVEVCVGGSQVIGAALKDLRGYDAASREALNVPFGRLGFLNFGGRVDFRNIKLLPLPPQ